MTSGREWFFSGDPLHQSVEAYLCEQLQGLTFARNKLVDIEKQIQSLMQERENVLYEIEIREANIDKTQQRMAECKQEIRDRWFDIRKRYGLGYCGASDSHKFFVNGRPFTMVGILKFLKPSDLRKAMLISKIWHEVSISNSVWSYVYKRIWGEVDEHACGVCRDLAPLPADKTRNQVIHNNKGVMIGGQRLREGMEDDCMMVDSDEMCIEPRISWMDAFRHRQNIENNWNSGKCTTHTFVGHTDWVTCIGVHRSQMVSGSWDSLLKVWDLNSKECIATLSGHSAGINDLDIHPSGNYFVSGSLDCTLRVWDMATYKCLWTLEGHTDQVSFVKFSQYPAHVVSTSLDGTIRVWNIDIGKCTSIFQGHTSGVTAMCVQGQYTITGATDGTIIVWDMAHSKKVHNLNGHTDRVTGIQLDLGSNRIVSASWDSTIKVWNVASGACVYTLTGHIFRVRCIDFYGDMVVSGAWDNEAKVWDLTTGQCVMTLSGHASYVWATQLLSQRRRVITGSWDYAIKVWDLTVVLLAKCCTRFTLIIRDTSEVLCVQTNSHRLIGASKDIVVWDFSGTV